VFIHQQLCVYSALSRCGLRRWDREQTCEKEALYRRELENSTNVHFIRTSQSAHLFRGSLVWPSARDLQTSSNRSCDGVSGALPHRPQEGNVFVSLGALKKLKALPQTDDQKWTPNHPFQHLSRSCFTNCATGAFSAVKYVVHTYIYIYAFDTLTHNAFI